MAALEAVDTVKTTRKKAKGRQTRVQVWSLTVCRHMALS